MRRRGHNDDPAPLGPVLEHYGIEVAPRLGWSKIVCPFHDEDEPSCVVDVEGGGFSCLAGETEVMTWDGTRSIRDLAGSSPRLLTSAGWVTAPVRHLGHQQLRTLTVSRNSVVRKIRATPDHRWFTRNGAGCQTKEVVTADLRPGDRLVTCAASYGRTIKPTMFGQWHGVVFGDGTRRTEASKGAAVRLFRDKRDFVEKIPFANMAHFAGTEKSGDFVQVGGFPLGFKSLPDPNESSGYLMGWLSGYFSTDGCVSKDGDCIISSSRREHLEFVKLIGDKVGVRTYDISTQIRRGKGQQDTPLYHIRLSRSHLSSEFFLRDQHLKRWLPKNTVNERPGWTVVSVVDQGESDDVYCAYVEGAHNFALAGNLLTGNCFACGVKGRGPAAFIMAKDDVEYNVAAALRDELYGTVSKRSGTSPRRVERGGFRPSYRRRTSLS